MSFYFCPDCRRDRRFNFFVEVANIFETTVQILASCSSCNKGKWIEVMKDVHENNKISELESQIKELRNILKEAGIISIPPKNISVPDPRGYSVNKIK